MYLCASVQVGMFFPLAEWTESGGEKTFVHTPAQFFQGMAMGLGVFEEFADYILGTEFRIGSVFLLLVLILVYRRFKLSREREYLK